MRVFILLIGAEVGNKASRRRGQLGNICVGSDLRGL